MSVEIAAGLAGVFVSGGVGGVLVGFHFRGFIPLRSPSNNVRLSNAKTDAEIEAARAEAELASARARSELESIELESTYRRAKARVETSKIESLGAVPGDDADVLLRVRRGEKGWTQKELGQRTRISPARISALENGASPTLSELTTLADQLDLALVPARLARSGLLAIEAAE